MPDLPVTDRRSMLERMRAGAPYIADDPEIRALGSRALELSNAYNATAADERDLRRGLLSAMLGSVGSDVGIRPPFRVDYGVHIHVGDRVFANFGLIALDVAQIVVGDDVQIGPNVQLLTPTHPIDPQQRRDHWEGGAPITIGANVWLGGGVIVLPGVTIGEDTVVGAGAVVSRDLPSGVVAAGNPARVIRDLDAEHRPTP